MKFFKKEKGYPVKERCRACDGTGDRRGNYCKDKPDFKSRKFRCKCCKGKGVRTVIYPRLCKYCGTPTIRYCCDSCFRDFEGD